MKFLVFIEQREGKIRKASLEALSLARRLAGEPVAAVLPGKGVAALASGLGKYGAGVVYVADRGDPALYTPQGDAGGLRAGAASRGPRTGRGSRTSRKRSAPRSAPRGPSWTRDGSITSTRWGRPAKSFRPPSTSPAASPARSSTSPAWAPPKSSSP